MLVSFKQVSTKVSLGPNSTGRYGYFYDGLGLALPPSKSSISGSYVRGTSSPPPADKKEWFISDMQKWAAKADSLIYAVGQWNASPLNYFSSGRLSDNKWHTYEYDISSYDPGSSPVLLYQAARGHTDRSHVYTNATLYASTFGMDIKLAPKVQSQATSGGTISYAGEKYYTYGTSSDMYTWQPARGYRTSKLLIDGKEVPIPENNSYAFANITANHSIEVQFERITSQLFYISNIPSDTQAPMPTEIYGSEETATVRDCSYTYKGHRFIGWNTKPDSSGDWCFPQSELLMAEDGVDISLYAQWEEVWHSITWIDNHTSQTRIEQIMNGYDAVSVPAPMHEGYRLTEVSITGTSSETGEILIDDRFLPEQLYDGYVLPEQYTKNIELDMTYTFTYSPIIYTITVEHKNASSGRAIATFQIDTEAFKEWRTDIYPKSQENFESTYIFIPENISVVDSDTGEQISHEELIKIISDSNGEPAAIEIGNTPARSITVALYYNTWVQMPETGTRENVILIIIGIALIASALTITLRTSNARND